MSSLDLLANNLLSPMVLAFGLGMLAHALKSDLKIPEALYQSLTIYLLLAIGLKGGIALHGSNPATLVLPILATIGAGLATTVSAYALLRIALGLTRVDAGALAAHYGSVSAVTFIAAREFAVANGDSPEALLVVLLVALEIPALVLGLHLAGAGRRADSSLWHGVSEILTGKAVLLLLGGLAIGVLAGPERGARVAPLFVVLFDGVLMLFLLDLGLVAARKLKEIGALGVKLVLFAIALPLAHGAAGAVLGLALGFSPGGAAVFAAMLSSASYIAAPAAVRATLPAANTGLYLAAALGVTFPFNLALGIPAYRWVAQQAAPWFG